ncbi:hypothetical protein KZ844_35215, partial [Pseudomonas aeruginosa]|uniref:hypothetical protein n=1 Tax=Pseudomonas aeruginosa TaxID=287 RepID=UPI001CA5D71A
RCLVGSEMCIRDRLWSVLQRDAPEPELSPRAARVLEVLREQGASFFDELSQDAHLLRSELENALGELVSVGRVNADSFAGLRTLLMPADKRSRQELSLIHISEPTRHL